MKTIEIKSKQHNYNVIVHNDIITLMKEFIKHDKKYFFVMDSKLESKYRPILTTLSPKSEFCILEGGENAKSLETYELVIELMLSKGINKNDILVSFGGGTIGDLTGYIAATYKRGINYIQIPTTTLAMIDSSIGGKTAINCGSIKNSVGCIYPPQEVLIGLNVLETLDKKNYNNGLFEAIKIGLLFDSELFEMFKANSYSESINEIICRSILLKKHIVEQDEDDCGIRHSLNFGHTFGHAIELETGLLHGEAIANGMLITSQGLGYFDDLKKVLMAMKCPIINNFPKSTISDIRNDKKATDDYIDFVKVPEIGKFSIEKMSIDELKGALENYVSNYCGKY